MGLILFWLGIIMLVISTCVLFTAYKIAKKTTKKVERLINEKQVLINENIKLQHDVFRLTYIVPELDEKENKTNGRKQNNNRKG